SRTARAAGLRGVADAHVRSFRDRPRHARAEHDDPGLADLPHRVADVAAHQCPGQHERTRAMKTSHSANRLRQLLLAHQWNRVDRDPLAADVVPVRLRYGALGDHADLRSAADDDHALAKNALKGGHATDLGDSLEPFEV